MSEHNDVRSVKLAPAIAAALVAAVLVVAPAAAAGATLQPRGEPPPPGDEPVLQPADDGQVVVLGTDDGVDEGEGPGAVGSGDDSGDPTGALEPSGVDLADAFGVALLGFVSLALTGISATRLRRRLHAWWSPPLPDEDADPVRASPTPSFSLILVSRGDEGGFGRTFERLATFDHPDVEILAVVGHNEPRTRELVVAAAYRQPDRIRVVTDRGFRRSEPRALNAGLAECRGDVVGVFRAGDEARPEILRHVETTLATTGADVLQTGVLLTSEDRSWLSVAHMVESYFWSRGRLDHYAQQRFTPLATTGLFVRTDVLRDAGGWDEDAVVAGCDLGVRLSVAGVPVAVRWDPEVVTRAAVPRGVRAVLHQQTRWIQGFLQVLRGDAWRHLPSRRQRMLAGASLAAPLFEALAGAVIPILAAVALVAAVAGAPAPLVLLACLPLVPALMTVVVDMAGADELRRTAGVHIRARDQLLLLLGAIPYRFLVATAAVRALVREARGEQGGNAEPGAAGAGDADSSAGGDPSERPPLVHRSAGRHAPLDEVATRAGGVDR